MRTDKILQLKYNNALLQLEGISYLSEAELEYRTAEIKHKLLLLNVEDIGMEAALSIDPDFKKKVLVEEELPALNGMLKEYTKAYFKAKEAHKRKDNRGKELIIRILRKKAITQLKYDNAQAELKGLPTLSEEQLIQKINEIKIKPFDISSLQGVVISDEKGGRKK
jgi:uncharacterized protein YfkK (UPF0435 family)